MLEKIMNSVAYKIFIFFAVMPANGVIISRGQVFLGIVLMALQIHWFYNVIIKKGDFS